MDSIDCARTDANSDYREYSRSRNWVVKFSRGRYRKKRLFETRNEALAFAKEIRNAGERAVLRKVRVDLYVVIDYAKEIRSVNVGMTESDAIQWVWDWILSKGFLSNGVGLLVWPHRKPMPNRYADFKLIDDESNTEIDFTNPESESRDSRMIGGAA